jgi:DNA-binding CsgD family transcriptional regulator
VVRAIAKWCEFLQGSSHASETLEVLAEAADVDVICVGRIQHDALQRTGGVVLDKASPALGTAKFDRTFAGDLLGSHTRSASPGTIWFGSMLGSDPNSTLSEIQRARGWNEIAIVPLLRTAKHLDVLEFHFRTDTGNRHQLLLNMLAGTLSDTWQRRRPGLLTEAMLARAAKEDDAKNALVPLLSAENPARLSRAEFRVCLLLSQGLSNEKVVDELEISLATLRTHLRNIYAKTGALGHSDLLYKLLNFAPLRTSQSQSVA